MNTMLRFTSSARQALTFALQEAEREHAATITIRHLLIGLARLPVKSSTAAHILNGFGVTLEKLAAIEQSEAEINNTPQIPLGDGVKRTLERAAATAQRRKDTSLASAHLLAGSLDDSDVGQLLASVGASKDRVHDALNSLHIWTDEP